LDEEDANLERESASTLIQELTQARIDAEEAEEAAAEAARIQKMRDDAAFHTQEMASVEAKITALQSRLDNGWEAAERQLESNPLSALRLALDAFRDLLTTVLDQAGLSTPKSKVIKKTFPPFKGAIGSSELLRLIGFRERDDAYVLDPRAITDGVGNQLADLLERVEMNLPVRSPIGKPETRHRFIVSKTSTKTSHTVQATMVSGTHNMYLEDESFNVRTFFQPPIADTYRADWFRNANASSSDNKQMLSLYKQDVPDGSKQDDERRLKVRMMLKSGGLTSPQDYYYSALMMYKGGRAADLEDACILGLKCVELHPVRMDARRMFAAAKDKLLVFKGEPQLFGACVKRDKTNGYWFQTGLDGRVSDAVRTEWGIVPLATRKGERRTDREVGVKDVVGLKGKVGWVK
jgi:hypothetical protein